MHYEHDGRRIDVQRTFIPTTGILYSKLTQRRRREKRDKHARLVKARDGRSNVRAVDLAEPIEVGEVGVVCGWLGRGGGGTVR